MELSKNFDVATTEIEPHVFKVLEQQEGIMEWMLSHLHTGWYMLYRGDDLCFIITDKTAYEKWYPKLFADGYRCTYLMSDDNACSVGIIN